MRKYLVIFFLIPFFLPSLIFAQQAGQRTVCLKPLKCLNNACGPKPKGIQFPVQLTTDPASPAVPNTQTYILACGSQGPQGQICTTGSSQADMIVYGQNNTGANLGRLSSANPTQSDPNGDIGTLYWSAAHRKVKVQFYGLNYLAATPTSGATGSPSVTPVGGLQQGPIIFEPGGEATPGAEQDCISISFDPYGRVFDARSLEPITGASVTLSMRRDDGSFSNVTTSDILGGAITNPQTTLEDGMFSFIIPDGTYKLVVADSRYTFPVADINSVHPNYSKIYADIYPASTGEEIVQVGEIQHRDIPVTALGTPTNNPPILMEYSAEAQPVSQKLAVEGRASHPFAKIIFYTVKPSDTDPNATVRNRQVGEIQADKMGQFSYEIDQTNFEPTESFGEVDLLKVDLTLLTKKNSWFNKIYSWLNIFIKKAEAQSVQAATIKFDPIPTYLEGYAYDSQGQVIANATVGVYLTFSSKPYYETKADETGYFKISSEHLPRMAYELRYTTPTGFLIKTSTSQFIGQNKDYLTENKTDLNVYKNEKGEIKTRPTLPTGVSLTGQPPTPTRGLTENWLILAAILIFLILLTVLLYLKRKPMPPPPAI